MDLYAAHNVAKSYDMSHGRVLPVLNGLTFTVARGEFLAVTGPSGSGKSSLLNLLGLLDRPSSGRLSFAGAEIEDLHPDALARIRNAKIGFVFQSFQLLPRLSARDNVGLPLIYAGVAQRERQTRAEQALESVGLGARMSHRPSQLSGGEQQRVAIARAIVNHPDVILADEPTGALDTETGKEIMDILAGMNDQGTTLVVVTHSSAVAARARRRIDYARWRVGEPCIIGITNRIIFAVAATG